MLANASIIDHSVPWESLRLLSLSLSLPLSPSLSLYLSIYLSNLTYPNLI